MKTRIAVVVVVLVLVTVCVFAVKDMLSHKTVSVKAPSSVPAGSLAPPEKFLVDYANYKILKQKVDDANVDLQGAIGRLNAQVPQGYQVDEKAMLFVPRQQSTPAPPSLTPAKP